PTSATTIDHGVSHIVRQLIIRRIDSPARSSQVGYVEQAEQQCVFACLISFWHRVRNRTIVGLRRRTNTFRSLDTCYANNPGMRFYRSSIRVASLGSSTYKEVTRLLCYPLHSPAISAGFSQ